MKLTLKILAGEYSISQLPPDFPLPDWAQRGEFLAVVRTPDELSLVCESKKVPEGVRSEPGYLVLCVIGPLDFSLVGILAGLSTCLAEVGVSVFAISTFNTDYLLVKNEQLELGVSALENAGHTVQRQHVDG